LREPVNDPNGSDTFTEHSLEFLVLGCHFFSLIDVLIAIRNTIDR
jgi:hypothetical protein